MRALRCDVSMHMHGIMKTVSISFSSSLGRRAQLKVFMHQRTAGALKLCMWKYPLSADEQ